MNNQKNSSTSKSTGSKNQSTNKDDKSGTSDHSRSDSWQPFGKTPSFIKRAFFFCMKLFSAFLCYWTKKRLQRKTKIFISKKNLVKNNILRNVHYRRSITKAVTVSHRRHKVTLLRFLLKAWAYTSAKWSCAFILSSGLGYRLRNSCSEWPVRAISDRDLSDA